MTKLSLAKPIEMTSINIHAAKTHLSRLIERVLKGEDVVLSKAGKPLVRLVPYMMTGKPRTPGIFKGKVRESADCWTSNSEIADSIERDEPLP